MHTNPKSDEKPRRIVFHFAMVMGVTFGMVLIAVGILGIPQMSFLTGRLGIAFEMLSSTVLMFTGVAWLFAIGLFLRFFDHYLSRN